MQVLNNLKAHSDSEVSSVFVENSISESDWTIINDITAFLKPLNDLTIILSGEKYPTLLKAVPLFNKLIDHVEELIGEKIDEDGYLAAVARNDSDDIQSTSSQSETIVQPIAQPISPQWNSDWSHKEAAAFVCRLKLVKYYSKFSSTLSIATFFNPLRRLAFFYENGWTQEILESDVLDR